MGSEVSQSEYMHTEVYSIKGIYISYIYNSIFHWTLIHWRLVLDEEESTEKLKRFTPVFFFGTAAVGNPP